MGGSPRRRPERYDLGSPAARLPLRVPQLLVHGARDRVVNVSQSIDDAAAARAAGDETLCIRADDGHFEHIEADIPVYGTGTTHPSGSRRTTSRLAPLQRSHAPTVLIQP